MGGRWASKGVFPVLDDHAPSQMPGIIPCIIVALALLAMGILVLSKGGNFNLQLPSWIDNYGLWCVSAIFIARAIGEFKYVGFFRKVRHTKFAKNDQRLYSPLCLAIGIMLAILEQMS